MPSHKVEPLCVNGGPLVLVSPDFYCLGPVEKWKNKAGMGPGRPMKEGGAVLLRATLHTLTAYIQLKRRLCSGMRFYCDKE